MKLAGLQRRVAAAIMSPLTGSDSLAPRTAAGRSMRAEAGELIKPNDRLTAFERLEIYSRSYWFRLLDSLQEDFPGLAAVLGVRAFGRCARAYLAACPSRSFTMRNLGSRLPGWLRKHPEFAGPVPELAIDMARLEWAHVEAFDGPEVKPLGPEDLLELTPGMKLALQPHITLLALRYPVDDIRIEAAGLQREHDATSNAVSGQRRTALTCRFRRTRPEPVHLAVHRMGDSVYYRRMERDEFRVLGALGAGKTVGEALAVCDDALAPKVEGWFAGWAEAGWLWVRGEAASA